LITSLRFHSLIQLRLKSAIATILLLFIYLSAIAMLPSFMSIYPTMKMTLAQMQSHHPLIPRNPGFGCSHFLSISNHQKGAGFLAKIEQPIRIKPRQTEKRVPQALKPANMQTMNTIQWWWPSTCSLTCAYVFTMQTVFPQMKV
jgi:hypothetical protein